MAQQHKGNRRLIACRAPEDQANHYEDCAKALGLDQGDYAVLVMARAHGLRIPGYIADKLTPGQLQLELEQRAGFDPADHGESQPQPARGRARSNWPIGA